MTDVYVMGDLHGYYTTYVRLLHDAGLIDRDLNWTGGASRLWQIGDLFDRGDQGVACVGLTMKLQQQALEEGGMVDALFGNHEMMLLCAARFGDEFTRSGVKVRNLWHRWGGIERELERLSGAQLDWIARRPLMALEGDRLLVHADSLHYVDYGKSIEEVNRNFADLLESTDLGRWEDALGPFCEHEAFSGLPMSGKRKAATLLRSYGGSVLVHGHTPIAIAAELPPEEVWEPWIYAEDTCVNVDGGLYLGGPGFLYCFELLEEEDAPL